MPPKWPNIPVVKKYWLFLFLIAACFAVLLLKLPSHRIHDELQTLKGLYTMVFPEWVRHRLRSDCLIAKNLLLSPYQYAFILVALLAENVRPVKKDSAAFLPAIAQDFIWFQTSDIFEATYLLVYSNLLKIFYDRHLSFLTIHALENLPIILKFILTLLIFDFIQWARHLTMHKVPYFWHFHAIHHSARGINVFTSTRGHPIDAVIAQTLTFIPLFMFQANPYAIAGSVLIQLWYIRIYHANLRTNYGPLKYFMITPQAHRIHHSILKEHREKNFGVLFTFWDRLFGTLHKNYDEYPDTGIPDAAFPLERAFSVSLLWNYVRQVIYPFRLIFRDLKLKVTRIRT